MSDKKVLISGLFLILITIAVMFTVMGLSQKAENTDQQKTVIDTDKMRFFGYWESFLWHLGPYDINNITMIWFKPDGTAEINGSGQHFGMGVTSRGYIVWSCSWRVIKVDDTKFVLILNNISKINASNGMIRGLLDDKTYLYILCEIKTKSWGDKLYFYDEVFDLPQQFYKIV